MDLKSILNYSEQIQAFIPKIKEFIPSLQMNQKDLAKKHNLGEGEFLLYSVVLTPANKIVLYCFKAFMAKGKFTIGNRQFEDKILIDEEIFRVELTQYLDIVEQQGLLGLMNVLPMDKLMGGF